MIKKAIYLTVMASLLTFSSSADTVILQDTPNPGDTTSVETITTGNPVTTDNLLSHDWTDGSWTGTMFPDSSDINESIYLTGKDGKYAESTIQSEGILTEAEIQQGLTSTLSAEIRWWNQWESTVTMTQTATDSNGTTTQSILLEDPTNHNYQFNTYSNTLIIAPDTESTHGSLTARFSFDVDDNAGNWNGGHSGVDIIEPDLKLNYNALTQTTVTTVEYCWEKNPPTCPAQDEIAEVETILDTFEDDLDDLYLTDIYQYEEETFIPETIDFEYSFNPEIFEEEEFEIEDDYLAFDDFFFEENYFEDDYYEEFELEEYFPEDIVLEEVEFFEEIPEIEMFDELPPIEEVFFEEDLYMEEEMYIEAFTDDAFIEEFDEMFEDMPMEEMNMEMAEEIFEEMFEEYFEEEPPIVEETFEEPIEEPIEEPTEIAAAEEPTEKEIEEIKEQPDSESVVADEPTKTESVTEQEESNEKPTEVADVKGDTTKEPDIVEQDVKGDPQLKSELDIKIATLEKIIKSQIKDTVQQTRATLNIINEVMSREMVATQPDMSSYANINQALFDTRQLPSGNQDFFMQVSLASYDKTIYGTQANLVGTDPIIQYQIKLNEARSVTDAAYIKLKGLLDARSNQ